MFEQLTGKYIYFYNQERSKLKNCPTAYEILIRPHNLAIFFDSWFVFAFIEPDTVRNVMDPLYKGDYAVTVELKPELQSLRSFAF